MKNYTEVMSDILNIVNDYHYKNHSYRSDEHEEQVNAIVDACQLFTRDKWIPVKEKLPENEDPVEVTFIGDDGEFVGIGYHVQDPDIWLIEDGRKGSWKEIPDKMEAVAWKKMSKPYKEE